MNAQERLAISVGTAELYLQEARRLERALKAQNFAVGQFGQQLGQQDIDKLNDHRVDRLSAITSKIVETTELLNAELLEM